jgi:hypothetical protein
MKRIRRGILAVALGASLLPAPARAQGWVAGMIGGALGMGAGGYVSLGIVTLEARRGGYIYGIDDVLGWRSIPVLAGTATGVTLGLWNQERLRHTVYGTIGGGALGTAVGALVGRHLWPPPEGKWAGAVVGGAAGILVGAAVGAAWPVDDGGDPAPIAVSVQIPLGR